MTEAAMTVAPKHREPRAVYWQALGMIRLAGSNGLTAEEVADALGVDIHIVRPRITELKVDGMIRPSGRRHSRYSGVALKVWVVVQ